MRLNLLQTDQLPHILYKLNDSITMKYILFAFTVALFSCGGIDRSDSRTISTEPLDTLTTRPAKLDARPLLFEAAFIPGATHKVKDSVIRLYAITIGKLK